MGVDDILLLVEAKAGGLSAAASRGAPRSMEREFSELIGEGQRQSERAERYIKSADEVDFFDETGKTRVIRIKHKRFRLVFRVVATRETLGWVGARIAVLSVLDPQLSKAFPWHISIDDLRVVAELFKGEPIRFVHYLEQRLRASSEATLVQHDEIDHVALYNAMNHYHDLPVQGMDRMTFASEYTTEIDHYFMARSAGEPASRPTQKMPTQLAQFISALGASGLPHRFEVGSIALSMDEETRAHFAQTLGTLTAGVAEGRQRSFRIPFTKLGFGITVSASQGHSWDEELRRSTVQMEYGQCTRWLVVQMSGASGISRIEILEPGQFSPTELASERARHEGRTRDRIAAERPGRNDLCPCGSGKKFKRCHGY